MSEPTPAATRPPLLILHGANGCRAEVQPWRQALSADFTVEALNLCGHGGRRMPAALTMAQCADDLLGQMDALGLQAPIVMGHSFGGVVALYLAVHHPLRVSGVVTLGTRWIFDDVAIGHASHIVSEARLLKLPARVDQLARMHHPNDWKLLAARLCAMYASFAHDAPVTCDELERIACPCLVMSGSEDPIASADETLALHHSLTRSTVSIYPGSAHPMDRVPVGVLREAISAWVNHTLGTPGTQAKAG